MSYSKIILQDSAIIVWPLDDITVSSSISKPINFYTNNPFSYSASISISNTDIVETPIVFGGGKSLRFTSSSVGMSIPALNKLSELNENKNFSMSLWFQTEYSSTDEVTIFKKRNFENIGLFLENNYITFRYGTSASFMEVSGRIERLEEPNHIIINKSPTSMSMMINGVLYPYRGSLNVKLPVDNSHSDNDYIDFYGPPSDSWIIDSIAMYPNSLTTLDARRHYVYGLGKFFGDDIFHSRGGSIYNFSTIDTEKIFKLNIRYPQEWYFSEFNNLVADQNGVRPTRYSEPEFYSYNQDIATSSNQISFKTLSGSLVNAAYIDITNLFEKIDSGDKPFLTKIKFDGDLPKEFEKQTIMTFGYEPSNEVVKFSLYNDSASYKILVESIESASTSFPVIGIESSPECYLGMSFDGQTKLYFVQSGSAVQINTFNIYNSDGYGVDPLSQYFPPNYNFVIRIGSNLTYDSSNYSTLFPSVNQFYGIFKNFSVFEKGFVTASTTFSQIDEYRNSKYKISFDTTKNRFKTFSYGDLTFNLHAIDIGEFINDTDQRISGNLVNIGYPDITSSSQVMFYVTHLGYSGSVIYPKTKLNSVDYLNFINNKNISGTYLKFDAEVYSEDSNYYPPIITSFDFETYKGDPDKVTLRSDAGTSYKIYNSSSFVYLPEMKTTPNVFITKNSGIKHFNSISEFTEDFAPKAFNPKTLSGLKLWLDSRFINGLNFFNPQDDSIINNWVDLSDNSNNAIQSVSSSAPVFRIQSKNSFINNQLNGAESGSTNGITAVNCLIESSADGAISGFRGVKLIPDQTSTDSYIHMNYNTASISVYANQEYSVVGSIKLIKPQTSSSLHNLSRSFAVYLDDGSGLVFTASSQTASNIAGTYSLFTNFTTSSATKYAEIRYYNGSSSESDVIYWDNLGLYVNTSSSIINSWVRPLTTEDDLPVIKFNGGQVLLSTASSSEPYTLYVLGRIFNNGSLSGYSSSGVSIYHSDGYLYVNSASSILSGSANSLFHIYTFISNSGSSSLYIDNVLASSGNISSTLGNLLIGNGIGGRLFGDISSVVLFSDAHSNKTMSIVNSWLDESFNLSKNIIPDL